MSNPPVYSVRVNGHQVAIRTSFDAARKIATGHVHHGNTVLIVNTDSSAEWTPHRSRYRPNDVEWICTRSGIAA